MAFETRDRASTFLRIRAFRSLWRLTCVALIFVGSGAARAATITVNSTADVAANDGQCTLREAIIAANTNTSSGAAAGECAAGAAGLDTIVFAIPGPGVKTIAPGLALPLPTITEAVLIDGYTQGGTANTNDTSLGSNAVLVIFLDMSSTFSGLVATAPTTIRGLAINPAFDAGILLNTGSDGSKIEGNFIGPNVAGSASAATTNGNGIIVSSSNNVIGGTTPAARNLISGTLVGINIAFGVPSNNRVEGNLIGTNAAGTAAIPNIDYGIHLLTPGVSNVIGGTTAAARNVISGNGISGVVLDGGGPPTVATNLVEGNYIGVDITGMAALGNGRQGVFVSFSSMNNVIGGTAAGAGNVISGNGSSSSVGFPNANVDADGSGSPGTLIQGNLIGPNAAGTGSPTGLPGVVTVGVILGNGATAGGLSAGAGNVIAFNPGVGVLVPNTNFTGGGPPVQNAAILSNSIYSNGQLGIDLGGSYFPAAGNGVTANDPCDIDTGPNNLQNFPVITSASIAGVNATISGTLNSTASTTFRVEFFSNAVCGVSGNGEGQTFLGFANVTTGPTCSASFGPLFFAVPPGQTVITSTATDSANNTSEFSACFAAGGATPTPTPTSTLTATPTPTPTGPTPTPALTPTPVPAGGVAAVPTLAPNVLAFLGLALALAALFVLRKSS